MTFEQIITKDKNDKSMQQNDKIISSIVLYKINPNEQELNGDITVDRNVDGRIFSDCRLEIVNDTAIIKDNDNQFVIGVFSLHHFYLLGV